ncbi:hypothetical protein F5Y10DRAFT_20627 [Nemania abortiva]|nr:hypothetical protein F5Y10DRAFT_20627 [Nemania abortiva]
MSDAVEEDTLRRRSLLIDAGVDVDSVGGSDPIDSWYEGTSSYSRLPGAAVGSELQWDFVALVSAVSQVYRSGIYLPMQKLNDETWMPLGQGATFRVSKSDMKVPTVPAGGMGKEIVATRLVLKRNNEEGKLSKGQIRSFIKEIRVLDHMRHHPFVVSLRAIGWFDEYSSELDRYHKPGIILEEAFDTLDYLIVKDISLPNPDLCRIFGQIAAGLSALHGAGVAHGDVKPGNILLFTDYVNRNNTRFETFSVKISDFGSAVFKDEDNLSYSPGTKGYVAPEVEAYGGAALQFDQILSADTWSLGILFVVVLCRSRSILQQASTYQDVTALIGFLISNARRHLDSSAAGSSETDVLLRVIRGSLKKRPSDRNLSIVEESLRPYVDMATYQTGEPLRMLPNQELYLGYENLKTLSGPFKDDLVHGLQTIARKDDHRAAKALWELGVICLTHFADPHHTVDDGLHYIRESAEAGDIRAKALCYRLHDAFESHALEKTPEDQRLTWLQEAAECGHRSAVEQLQELDPEAAVRAQATFAANFYQSLDEDSTRDYKLGAEASGPPAKGDSSVHRAAATGLVKDLAMILMASDGNLNLRNNEGDTPLMAACRFGQLETALYLLERGADATLRNDFGENALHYIWSLNAEDGCLLARELLAQGAKVDDVSERSAWASELDIWPIIRGTPLERAAARGRDDLVLIFLESGEALRPSNGRLARHLLFWSLAFPNCTLLDLVLTAIEANRQYLDETLPSLTEGQWTYNGERRSLLDAVCGGPLSYSHRSYNIPIRLWLAACHGPQWKVTLQNVISRWVQFLNEQGDSAESMIDQSIQWSLDGSFHDAFMALLRLKYEMAGPTEVDTLALGRLRWQPRPNLKVIRPHAARLIDQVFYNGEKGGTLAHQALMKGDRYLFWILVHRYRANPAHPIPPPEPHPRHRKTQRSSMLLDQMNPYVALVYAEHHDLWFSQELARLNVPLNCPWDENPYKPPSIPKRNISPTYLPPLLHAIGNCWWAYALWLLQNGASLEDQVTPFIDVLGAIMASRSRSRIHFVFRGCNATGGAAQFLPSHYNEAGGHHVICLYFRTRKLRNFRWVTTKPSAVAEEEGQEDSKDIYEYLLEAYPEAENTIKSSGLDAVSGRSQSLIHQAAKHDASTVPMLILVLRGSLSDHRKQNLREYLYGSPADVLRPKSLAEVMANCPGLTFRHFAPSIMWIDTLRLWIYPLASALALWLFHWFVGSDPSWWQPETWPWQVFVTFVLRVTWCIVIATFGIFGAVAGGHCEIEGFGKLWPWLRPMNWASAFLLLNVLMPLLLGGIIGLWAMCWSIAGLIASFKN